MEDETMEDEWRASVTDAVNSCEEVQLDELLKIMGRSEICQLDFSSHTGHTVSSHTVFAFYSDHETKYSFRRCTPLGLAVSKGYNRIAEQLLCAGASVDFAGKVRYTPPMLAAVYGHKESCRLLLNHGADINLRNAPRIMVYQGSALYYAACNGRSEVVSLLLEKGAILHRRITQNRLEKLPIVVATICNDHPHTLQTLLEYFENVALKVPLGALFTLGFDNSEECTVVILRHGFYPVPNRMMLNCSYFHESAIYGLIKVMCLLVELNPQYMQEEWLVNQEYIHALAKHPTFTSWLNEYRKHPPTLTKMCRSTVLAQLGSYFTANVKYLPLPSALKTFLATLQSAYDED